MMNKCRSSIIVASGFSVGLSLSATPSPPSHVQFNCRARPFPAPVTDDGPSRTQLAARVTSADYLNRFITDHALCGVSSERLHAGITFPGFHPGRVSRFPLGRKTARYSCQFSIPVVVKDSIKRSFCDERGSRQEDLGPGLWTENEVLVAVSIINSSVISVSPGSNSG
jgi:hypothetical protein